MATELLRFPLDSSMRIVFTGYFNGFSVEVRSLEEIALLHHMGCFGKGSASRSKPKITRTDSPSIMRKRQFIKRNYWHKKFGKTEMSEANSFLREVDEFVAVIVSDSEKQKRKDVIDLVSSDEDNDRNSELNYVDTDPMSSCDKEDNIAVIVANSDSEEENYFAKLKPKCCINKVKVQEKLMLTLQEAFFLSYGLGCLQVINSNNQFLDVNQCWELFMKSDRKFIPKYIVYHYFRSKGYIVKPGIKFGGDYLLYTEGPGVTHADYIVVIKTDNYEFNWISILGHIRMANTTDKQIIIAEVCQPKEQQVEMKLPDALDKYSVRETLLSRNIPVTINDSI